MATLTEQLFSTIDGSKGDLLLNGVVDVNHHHHQLLAGKGMYTLEGQENDPFSSCLMDMDLTSPMTEDLMVEEHSGRASSSSSSPPSTPSFTLHTLADEDGVLNTSWSGRFDGNFNNMEAWSHIPTYLQDQLFTHYGLYLKEIQQVLDMQLNMDIASDHSSSTSSSPSSSTPASPQAPKVEKRKKSMPSFKVEHYKLHNHLANKRPKRDDSEPLSPSYNNDENYNNNNNNNSNFSSYSLSIDSSASPSSPSKFSSVAEELANALLPSVSQIEEEIRAGTSSPSAATTVMELSKNPELLTLKQSEAAKIMGISTSVLSKRWREATRGKKWPHRIHHKLKRAALC